MRHEYDPGVDQQVCLLLVVRPARGLGTEGNPMRRVTQVWTLDGKTLIAEYDPCAGLA